MSQQIEVIESISNQKQYIAVTIDGQCNHGGQMVEEDVEDDNSHKVVRCGFCNRCGAQWDDLNAEWMENLSSRSHVALWTNYFMNGGPMPKFALGEPIVAQVVVDEMETE